MRRALVGFACHFLGPLTVSMVTLEGVVYLQRQLDLSVSDRLLAFVFSVLLVIVSSRIFTIVFRAYCYSQERALDYHRRVEEVARERERSKLSDKFNELLKAVKDQGSLEDHVRREISKSVEKNDSLKEDGTDFPGGSD